MKHKWYHIFFSPANIEAGEKLKIRMPGGLLLVLIISVVVGLCVLKSEWTLLGCHKKPMEKLHVSPAQ